MNNTINHVQIDKTKLIRKVKMSYIEIMQALEQGQKVCWSNSAYKVFLDNDKLHCINIYNSYMTALAEAEYKECFIEGA